MFRSFVLPVVLLFLCCAASGQERTLRVHRAKVTSLAWSPDGKTLASGDEGGLVVLSDARTGKTRLRLNPGGEAALLGFAANGNLAIGRNDEVRLVSAASGALVRAFRVENDDAQFWPDGRRLTIISYSPSDKDRSLRASTWNLLTGRRETRRRWKQEKDEFDEFAAAISPGGRRIVVGTNSKLRIYDLDHPAGQSRWNIEAKNEPPFVLQVAWSPGETMVANTGGYYEGPGHFDVWDARTHRRLWSKTVRDWAPCLTFSPHNRLLAVGTVYDTVYVDKPRAPGGDVLLYDLRTHRLTRVLRGHKQGVNVLAWSPDGKALASGSDEGTVKVWRLTQ